MTTKFTNADYLVGLYSDKDEYSEKLKQVKIQERDIIARLESIRLAILAFGGNPEQESPSEVVKPHIQEGKRIVRKKTRKNTSQWTQRVLDTLRTLDQGARPSIMAEAWTGKLKGMSKEQIRKRISATLARLYQERLVDHKDVDGIRLYFLKHNSNKKEHQADLLDVLS